MSVAVARAVRGPDSALRNPAEGNCSPRRPSVVEPAFIGAFRGRGTRPAEPAEPARGQLFSGVLRRDRRPQREPLLPEQTTKPVHPPNASDADFEAPAR